MGGLEWIVLTPLCHPFLTYVDVEDDDDDDGKILDSIDSNIVKKPF